MAGTGNPLAASAAAAPTPCKISAVGPSFQVNTTDLPVSLVIESDPTACQFTIAQIDIYDSGGRKVYSKPGINATTADLPKLPAGDYDVFVVPSPAVTAQVGNPYAGGTARIYESCAGKTLLYIANVNFPTPQFDLEVT